MGQNECGGDVMEHELKIRQCFLMSILDGSKTFEIRKNDRDFQVGDKIKFLPLECENNNVYEKEKPLPEFKINYVLSGFEGLADGYVGLSISRTTTAIYTELSRCTGGEDYSDFW